MEIYKNPKSALDEPEFENKWCEEKQYQFLEYVPNEKMLLKKTYQYEPKYRDVQVFLFYNWYRAIPILEKILKRGLFHESNKRLVVNFKEKKCCPFPDKDLHLIREGKISSNNIFLKRKQHLLDWVDEQQLTFDPDLYWEQVLLQL